MSQKNIAISIIIPVKNEQDNIVALLDEFYEIFDKIDPKINFEILVINDASTDKTVEYISNNFKNKNEVLIYSHSYSAGQSAAIATGMKYAKGNWIMTIDGDGQNDPSALLDIWPEILKNGDNILYNGYRQNRQNSIFKNSASYFANGIRRFILNDNCKDSGCGFKVFSKKFVEKIPKFKNMHRFMPALAKNYGFELREFPIQDRERKFGKSNYGNFDRALMGIYDLFGIAWLMNRKLYTDEVKKEK